MQTEEQKKRGKPGNEATEYLHWTITLEVVVIPSTTSLLVAVQRYSPLSLSVTSITTSSLLAIRVAFSLVELIVMRPEGVIPRPSMYQ